MLFRAILFSFFFSILAVRANHAIYLSVLEIKEESVSIKVFSDDLRDVIRNDSDDYVKGSLDEFVDLNLDQIIRYFNSRLEVIINGKLRLINLQSSKKENDAHFLYFSFECDSDWERMEVKGSYFMELFPNQSNVLTIIKEEKKHFARLTQSSPTYSITF